MSRKTAFASVAAVLSLALSGCMVVPGAKHSTAEQLDVIGNVRVATTVCPIDIESFDCMSRDRVLEGLLAIEETHNDLDTASQQYLLAYRVPAGTTAPETLSATVEVVPETYTKASPLEPDELDVTFRRSADLAAQMPDFMSQLTTATPLVGAGQELVAYVSDAMPGSPVSDFTVTADFVPPEDLAGPFNRLVMIGMRLANRPEETTPAHDPERPFVCFETQEPRPRRYYFQSEGAGCPIPAERDEGDRPVLDGQDLFVRALTVAGGETTAEQGQTVDVPFQVRFRGAPAPEDAPALALTGATPIPGATATARDASVPLPEGDADQPVSVAIPADALPGTYEVTLSAKIGDTVRTGTALLHVTPKPVVPTAPTVTPPPPAAQVAQSRSLNNLYVGKDGKVPFGFICPLSMASACPVGQADILVRFGALNATASQAQKLRLMRLGRAGFAGKAGSRVRPKVQLGPKARRALRRGRSLQGLLVVRSGENGAPHVRRVLIRRLPAR